MVKTYRANGKLLLTGEYLVLSGVESIVLPTKYGQELEISTDSEFGMERPFIIWNALETGHNWFSAQIDKDLSLIKTTDISIATRLLRLLKALKKLNSEVFNKKLNYKFTTYLEFDRNWGLGSSSTLISILAQWANVDPYELHFMTSNGSAFDIAAAQQNSPFIYRRSNDDIAISTCNLPSFLADHIWFVYLGRKIRSDKALNEYFPKKSPTLKKDIREISTLSRAVCTTRDFRELADLFNQHEKIIAQHIARQTVKEIYFSDYDQGAIKSLGAWGGDFVLFLGKNKVDIRSYIQKKGFNVLFSYEELIREEVTI